MRVFIAIPCPEELRKRAVELQEAIKDFGKMSLVKQENIHTTLKFLGEIKDEKIPQIVERLGFLSGIDSFGISLRGIGVFPKPAYIRVVWIGIDKGQQEICNIQKRIDKELKEMGFKPDSRFHSHLTIARVKFLHEKKALGEFLEKNKALELGEFKAQEVELMESKLSPKGAEYSVLEKFTLG